MGDTRLGPDPRRGRDDDAAPGVVRPPPEVEVGTETFTVAAEELSPEERAKVWPHIVSERPGFGDYEQKTTRVMPVLRLRR